MATPTLRSCIIAEEGYSFVSLDASQIELRVLAVLSQDPQMLEDLNYTDLHLATAIRMFGWTDDADVMKERRYDAKQANFALVYGAGEEKLAEMLDCDLATAAEFMAMHKQSYPVLYQWMEDVKTQAKEDGYVVNMFGRIRPLPELQGGSWKMREAAEREIVNTLVQGTAVDIVKLAMLYLRKLLDIGVRLVLQVHDEILFELPDSLIQDSLVKCRTLAGAFPDYPFTITIGRCYAELEEVK